MLVLLLAGCHATDSVKNPKAAFAEAAPGVFKLTFEAETLTVRELANAATATSLEKIQAMPTSSKTKIKLTAYEDGTSDWYMEKLMPEKNLQVKSLSPPNDQPPVMITRIDRSGTGYFYDRNGNLLNQNNMETPSLAEIVANVKQNPNAVFSALGVKTAWQVDKLIATAKAKGGTVTETSNGLLSIKTPVNGGSNGSNVRTASANANLSTTDVFDKKAGVLLTSTLTDLAGNVLARSIYKYAKNTGDKLVPEVIQTEVWKTNAAGQQLKTLSITHYTSVNATIN